MEFQDIFAIYFRKYRGEAIPPTAGDDEFTIAVSNYNSALLRMQVFDDTKWNFLYNTLQNADDGDTVVKANTSLYEAPSDMAEPGGQIILIDSSNNRTNLQLIQPYQQQAMSDTASYGYFIGGRNNGYNLNINGLGAGDTGKGIDYVYYRNATQLDSSTEDGTSIIEDGDPLFFINHMLANRLTPDENFAVYQIAMRDAETALNGMKLKNNSGTHYSAWGMQDTGSGFGIGQNNNNIFGGR